jgi:hypothetical protein
VVVAPEITQAIVVVLDIAQLLWNLENEKIWILVNFVS